MRVGASSDCFFLPRHSLLCYPRQDGQGMDIAESWRIDVDTHMIRKSSYKGHGCKVSSDRLKIPFEGLTIPGAIFTVARTLEEASFREVLPSERKPLKHPQASYVLQTRGCRPEVQKGALDCLGVILGACVSGSLQIPLLPNKRECDSD